MSSNVVRISKRPDNDGYLKLEHTGIIYDGTKSATNQRTAEVPSSAAAEELIRRIGKLVGGTPPEPGIPEVDDEVDIQSVEETLTAIDDTLEAIESNGADVVPLHPDRNDPSTPLAA